MDTRSTAPYTMLCAINKATGDTLKVSLTEEEYAAGQKVISPWKPTPSTKLSLSPEKNRPQVLIKEK